MRLTAAVTLAFITAASSRAWADPSGNEPAVTPSAEPSPAAATAAPNVPPSGYAPPPGYAPAPGYPPPPAYPPPPGYAPPPGNGSAWTGGPPYGGYAPNPNAMFLYEAQSKNAGVAVLLSLVVPGLGSIYANHVLGAVITWALIVGGVVVIADSVQNANNGYGYQSTTNVSSGEATIGVLMLLGGFVYSPIDAYISSEDYNRALAQHLGLPDGFALLPAPIRTDRSVAWGPSLSLRF